MTAIIPSPADLWHRNYDEVLGDSPDGALDTIVRRMLHPVPDATIEEIDRMTERAVEAARAAILHSVTIESRRSAVD